MARRYFSSTAAATSLSSGIGSGTTSITVGSVSGFPGSYPYTLILDPDTVNEEVVSVTAGAGTTLTVTRGQDGTAAVAHSAAAVVKHGVSARDFDEPNAHVNASAAVHGLSGTVVGTTDTQTLTNKTLTAPTIGGSGSHTGALTNTGSITGGTVNPTTLGMTWTSWTPTFTNITGGAGQFYYKLIDAKTLLVRGYFSAGTITATGASYLSLPASKTGVASAFQPVALVSSAAPLYGGVPSGDTRIGMQSQTMGQSLVGFAFNGVIEVQ